MFKITALKIAQRVSISRSGVRVRRLPTLQIANGACVKIAPGRSTVVSEQVVRGNLPYLIEIQDQISILDLSNMQIVNINAFEKHVSANPVGKDDTITSPPSDPKLTKEVEAEEVIPEEIPVEEPTVVEAKEEKPAPKKPARKRRSRAKKVEK